MAAASPSLTSPPSIPGAPAVMAPSLREGAFREVGAVRHANVHAQRYRLAGTGKVLGEVDVEEGLFDGVLSIGGNLSADRIQSEGSLEVGGDVTVRGRFLCRGSLRVAGNLVAASTELRGVSRIAKDMSVETQLSYHGTLEVGGRLSVALFSPDGRFTIGGALTAREIIGAFDGASQVETIEAPSVTLRPKAWVRLPIDLPPLRPKGSLVVDRIEADSVDLEGVTVHYLKAPTIRLGRNCHVTQAEGRIVHRDRSSHVGFESRSPPPPGMSR